MDYQLRRVAVSSILRQYDAFAGKPGDALLSLDAFFSGNDDAFSIGANLGESHPGIDAFQKTLTCIRRRRDVQDVLVAALEVPDVDCAGDDDMWVVSDRIYVVTSESESTVEEWCEGLSPSSVGTGWYFDGIWLDGRTDRHPTAPQLGPGMYPRHVWWD